MFSPSLQSFVFVTGLALLPTICALSTLFFVLKTGLQLSTQSSRKRGQQLPVRLILIKTLQGATRWNVASLYVLYCPTLIIFMTCCSFDRFDAPRQKEGP